MAEDILTTLYGRGWAWPPAFSLEEGVAMAQGVEDIRQSLCILFSTEPGERVMRDNYGCALYDLMFENVTDTLAASIERRIVDSVLRYEPRAKLTKVRVTSDSGGRGRLAVEIDYCLRGSQIEQSIHGLLDVNNPQGGWVL